VDFDTNQKYSLLSKMGYNGPAEGPAMEAFIQSSPGVAARMGKFSRALQKRTSTTTGGMAAGGQVSGYATGGFTVRRAGEKGDWRFELLDSNKKVVQTFTNEALANSEAAKRNAAPVAAPNPTNPTTIVAPTVVAPNTNTPTPAPVAAPVAAPKPTPSAGTTLSEALIKDPTSLTTKPDVANIAVTPETLIAAGAGQVTDQTTATTTAAPAAAQAAAVTPTPASIMQATQVGAAVKGVAEGTEAATGKVSDEVTAQTMDANQLASLGLSAPQINQIRQVLDTGDLKVTPDQLAQAATLANQGMSMPEAVAQVTGQPKEVVAAKFTSSTPTAQAATDSSRLMYTHRISAE
jgi:hypothetical protein